MALDHETRAPVDADLLRHDARHGIGWSAGGNGRINLMLLPLCAHVADAEITTQRAAAGTIARR